MVDFTLEQLESIARKVIGDSTIKLAPSSVAGEVPGWDSLNHTLITMEVNDALRIDIPPNRTARARNFGHLLMMINRELRAKT